MFNEAWGGYPDKKFLMALDPNSVVCGIRCPMLPTPSTPLPAD
jgi:hypothetical protein